MTAAPSLDSTLAPAEQRKLAALARAEFCSQVRRCAGPIDQDSVLFYGRLCETLGHKLMNPRLQYLCNDANRGRYYVTCKQEHGAGSRAKGFFKYVSKRLQVKVRSELENWRIAREFQDEGTRLIDVPARSGQASYTPGPRSYSIPRLQKSRGPALLSARAAALPAKAGRARSLSVELVESPGGQSSRCLRLDVLFYSADERPPIVLSMSCRYVDMHVFMRDFADVWEKEEVKMQEPVKVLTYADDEMMVWQPTSLRRLVLPPRTRRIVVARDRVSAFHHSLDGHRHWSCNVISLPSTIKSTPWPEVPADWVF